MDIPLVLEALGLAAQDWGTGASSSCTYEQLLAGWRGSVPCPSRAAMEAKWAELSSSAAPAVMESFTPDEVRAAVDDLAAASRDALLRELLADWLTRQPQAAARAGIKLKKRGKS